MLATYNNNQDENQLINLDNVTSISIFDNEPHYSIKFRVVSNYIIEWSYESDKEARDRDMAEIVTKMTAFVNRRA